MKRITIFLVTILACFSLQAQEADSVFYGNNYTEKFFGAQTCRNYTKEGDSNIYILMSKGNILNNAYTLVIDDSLNLKRYPHDTVFKEGYGYFYFGDQINFQINEIGYRFYAHRQLYSSTNIWIDTVAMTDLCLQKFNITNSIYNTRATIFDFTNDSIKWLYFQIKSLKNNNILICLVDTTTNTTELSHKVKLIEIDTLGNVIKTKLINHLNRSIDVCEVNDTTILLSLDGGDNINWIEGNAVIYYLDRNTFDIKDSMNGFPITHMKRLTDDMIFAYCEVGENLQINPIGKLNIFNIATQLFTTINYQPQGHNSSNPYSQNSYNIFMPYGGEYKMDDDNNCNVTDFMHLDSVYTCYYVSRNGNNFYNSHIEILGLNVQQLDTNFVFPMYFDTTSKNIIEVIKATKDGGVIFVCKSGINYNTYFYEMYAVKFMPNGFASIRDLTTGEKESIRVYPVPAKDWVCVQIESKNIGVGSNISIYNMSGELATQQALTKADTKINVSSLAAGAYTYAVVLNGKSLSGKLIIQ